MLIGDVTPGMLFRANNTRAVYLVVGIFNGYLPKMRMLRRDGSFDPTPVLLLNPEMEKWGGLTLIGNNYQAKQKCSP